MFPLLREKPESAESSALTLRGFTCLYSQNTVLKVFIHGLKGDLDCQTGRPVFKCSKKASRQKKVGALRGSNPRLQATATTPASFRLHHNVFTAFALASNALQVPQSHF